MRPILTAFVIAAGTAGPAAGNEFIYTLLPPAQAEALKNAKRGVRLPPYDKAYFAWTAVEMSAERCNVVGESERRNMEITWTLALQFAVFENAIAAMQAQFNLKDRLIPMNGCGTELGGALLSEIIDVLKSDNSSAVGTFIDDISKPRTKPKRLF